MAGQMAREVKFQCPFPLGEDHNIYCSDTLLYCCIVVKIFLDLKKTKLVLNFAVKLITSFEINHNYVLSLLQSACLTCLSENKVSNVTMPWISYANSFYNPSTALKSSIVSSSILSKQILTLNVTVAQKLLFSVMSDTQGQLGPVR